MSRSHDASLQGFGTPAHAALKRNDICETMIRFICTYYPGCICIPDSQNIVPLHLAARRLSLDMFKFILTIYPAALMEVAEVDNINLDVSGTPFRAALRSQHVDKEDIINFICDQHPGVLNTRDIHAAAVSASLLVFERVVLILDSDELVTSPDDKGCNIAHFAATFRTNASPEDIDVVKFICQRYPSTLSVRTNN